MLEVLTSHPSVERFLGHYPKHQWRRCIEQVVLFGVRKIEARYNTSPPLEALKELAVNRHKDRHTCRKRAHATEARHTLAKHPALKATPPKLVGETPRFKEFESEARPQPSENKESGSGLPQQSSRQLSEQKMPRYLENVQSKMKDDIARHIDSPLARKTPDRYDLPRQLPSEELKARHRAAGFKEPVTVEMEVAREIFKRQSPKKEGQLLRIAETFLKDPYMTQLAKKDSQFAVPSSPKYLEGWMNSPQANLLTSLELKRGFRSPEARI
jgi:hypothetical protein